MAWAEPFAPQPEPEDCHHLVAVEIGADRLELLLLTQHDDPGLEFVHPRQQACAPCARRVRAVTSRQLVELVEQIAGVADVAAHRAVGPHAVAVAVESQVQEHEPLHGFDLGDTGTEADRPEFNRMLAEILGDGVRTILVESLDRLARDVMVQSLLLSKLADTRSCSVPV